MIEAGFVVVIGAIETLADFKDAAVDERAEESPREGVIDFSPTALVTFGTCKQRVLPGQKMEINCQLCKIADVVKIMQ